MLISPAILAHNEKEFCERIALASAFPKVRWHIDVLDGSMFGATSWHNAESIGAIKHLPEIELHLMTTDPFAHACAWHRHVPSFSRAIVQAEIPDAQKALRQISALGVSLSLAISPDVPPDSCMHLKHLVDEWVVMGVHPGASGQSFLGESILAKISRVRALAPEHHLALDGGVTLHNISGIATQGVLRAITSSALWGSPDPIHAHEALRSAANVVL